MEQEIEDEVFVTEWIIIFAFNIKRIMSDHVLVACTLLYISLCQSVRRSRFTLGGFLAKWQE